MKYKQKTLSLVFAIFLIVSLNFTGYSQITVDDTTPGGVETFTVPAGVTSLTVECIGGGGGGGAAVATGAGGGGGGAYSMAVIVVTPGQNISYTVGSGGPGGPMAGDGQNGSVSSFGVGPTLVSATGGTGTVADAPLGGTGGSSGSCIGDASFSGGVGGNFTMVMGFFPAGGGGGGAAGALGVGATAVGPLGGAGTAPGGNGADGGNGGSPSLEGLFVGQTGSSPGGGGSGGGTGGAGASIGGDGADGLVRITYAASCGPGTQPSNNSVGSITGTSATISWTAGSGSGGEVIFLKQGSAIGTDPVDNTTYAANSAFGSGDEVEVGAFAIYNGSGTSAPVTGLVANTTYYYSVFTYNSAGPCYLSPTTITGSFTTLACVPPAIQPSDPSVACLEHETLSFTFTRGNGQRAIVVAKAVTNVDADPVYSTIYTANPNFGSGTQIGTGNYVVYDGNDAGTITVPITGLTPGTEYFFKAYEYDESPNCYNPNSPANASGTTRNPAFYSSSTTSQNTTNVERNALAQDVILLTVVVNGGEDYAATMNSITFNSNGTTNTATDLTNVRVFYTGSDNTFSDETQFGSTFTTFGTNTANDNFALLQGNNYFWIAYDVKNTASLGNVLDAEVTSINITDYNGTSNETPTATAPAGSRLIINEPCGIATPVAKAPQAGCNTSTSQGEFLQAVSFGTEGGTSDYSFSGSCAPAVSYYDRTATNNFTVLEGSTNNLSITWNDWLGLFYEYNVWIDWNNNGDFRDAGERYPASGGVAVGSPINNILIPVTATSVKMRIWVQADVSWDCPYNVSNGPSSTSLGQIMDVTVLIPDATGPLPAPPSGVSCATLAPTVTTPVNYTHEETASQLTATGTSLLWYSDPKDGVGSGTAPTPTTNSTGTQTYYVSQNTGCEGPRTQIAVRVETPAFPTAPVASVSSQATCVDGGEIDLSGLPTPGTWTIEPSTTAGSGGSYTFSDLDPGNYSYTVINSIGCISPESNIVTIDAYLTEPASLNGHYRI